MSKTRELAMEDEAVHVREPDSRRLKHLGRSNAVDESYADDTAECVREPARDFDRAVTLVDDADLITDDETRFADLEDDMPSVERSRSHASPREAANAERGCNSNSRGSRRRHGAPDEGQKRYGVEVSGDGQHARDWRNVERPLLQEGDVLLGKFQIDRLIAEGPTCVALATHLELRMRAHVAVLAPNGRGFAAARECQRRAVHALAQMQSEYLCRIADAGTLSSGASFMITELAGHTNLAEHLGNRGPLPVTEAVDYIVQAAEALAEAHALGLVHGSLSPSCLRIASGIDGWPGIRLLGFGLATPSSMESLLTLANERATARSSSALRYLAPEQIRRLNEQDRRVDIWALGAILHESLTGSPPFSGETNAATLAMIAADRVAGVSAFREGIPRQLEIAILRCLEKDQRARFDSMAEFVRALQPFASEDAQRIAERVVRVVARGSARRDAFQHSSAALVHVRQPSAVDAMLHASGPAVSSPNTMQSSRSLTTASVVGIGLLAGIGGALAATFILVLASARLAGASAGPIADQPTALSQRSYAATPIAPAAVQPSSVGRAIAQLPRPAPPRDVRPPTPPRRDAFAPVESVAASRHDSVPRGAAVAAKSSAVAATDAPSREAGLFDDIK